MKLSEYKLVVTDLDGTLVKSGTNDLAETTINVMCSLGNQGIVFTLATGRSWRQTQPIALALQIKSPVIVQSGAIIMNPLTGGIIRTTPLRKELRHRLERSFRSTPADLFCLDETGTYFATEIKTRGGIGLTNEEPCKNGESSETPSTVIKYLYIGPESVLKQLAEQIQKIKPKPNLVLWPPDPGCDDWFLEVFDPMASKGQAVKWLAEYLKVERGQVMAFGDGYNDVDLLGWAGLGISIEGAPPVVISQADQVIPGPELAGVAHFLSGRFNINVNQLYLKSDKRLKA
jgi:Cof subfamily protein (haloacid dehalogenase superfamily)